MLAERNPDGGHSWGREVSVDTSGPYPMLTYTRRRHLTPELLQDVRRFGSREYVVQGDVRLTFAEHEDAVSRAAGWLLARGIGPTEPVMLLGGNSIPWLVAFWAVQRIGAVAVLGNVWWSSAEADELFARVKPRLTLVEPGLAQLVPSALRTESLEDVRGLLAPDDPVPALAPLRGSEHDPAVVLFSAGTTGSPKGVVLPHRAIIANVHNVLNASRRLPQELDLGRRPNVSLHTMPLFHIGGLQTSMTNLMAGGKTVFLTGRFDPGEALELIDTEGVTHWAGVPTMLSRMIEHPEFESFDTSSVRSIVIAGSTVPQDLRERAATRFAGVRSGGAVNYGLSESGGTICLATAEQADRRPGTVGRPVGVAEIRIAPPAPGMPAGEVLVRGAQIMLGYWGQTPDRGPVDADGWLHTGDLGRIDKDGWLYLLGRSKDIIIRGGENIASAHVEARLRQHPHVLDVAVVGLPHPDLGEEVGAAVLARIGTTLEVDELRRFAAEALARFAVPTRWWLRTEPLPTNAVGKVLKRVIAEEFPAGDAAPSPAVDRTAAR